MFSSRLSMLPLIIKQLLQRGLQGGLREDVMYGMRQMLEEVKGSAFTEKLHERAHAHVRYSERHAMLRCHTTKLNLLPKFKVI